MTDSGPIPGQDVAQPQASPKMSAKRRAAKAKKEIQTRCAVAGLKCEDVVGLDSRPSFRVGLRCGRDLRWVYLEKNERIIEFPSIDFEKWVFLSEYNAICSYEGGVIEAQLRFLSPPGDDRDGTVSTGVRASRERSPRPLGPQFGQACA